ncbi:unnamed protein product [Aureobasidium uvarum]|uniref:Stc1 domain-containing protein n=1 Tax=Aureobasidium uvarum TaxID=2773716 RepID=A0A9N8PUP8_9PEZI|nr:unnamed protein product [Aureobasidium uvarum]
MDSSARTARSLPLAYRNARSLPNKCSQFRPLVKFAKNRQNDATFFLTSRGARMGDKKILEKLLCNNCTGAPPVELKCTGCNRKRPLDHFSTTQRNAPDTARCRMCISQIESFRPGQQQELEKDGSDDEYIAVTSTDGGVPLTPDKGFVPVPSTSRSTRVPTNTTTSGTSSSGRSISSLASTVKAPPLKIGTGGFAVVKQGFREVPVPEYIDDDEVVSEPDSELDYEIQRRTILDEIRHMAQEYSLYSS